MPASPFDLVDFLKQNGLVVALAESCTGGMIASAITNVPGSSTVFDRGFVTYSNQAKIDCLGVNATTLESFGAVSEETAVEMALGALKNSDASIALSVTGVAGPGGGSKQKPVGIVYFGLAGKNFEEVKTFQKHFSGDRNEIRSQATRFALLLLQNEV
ncbi:MAG: damage-inducible protein CinA [Alphaproteobacteria bacterium]|nr:damage-inducible protein CinA [Alphaproteobacteria bacterium]